MSRISQRRKNECHYPGVAFCAALMLAVVALAPLTVGAADPLAAAKVVSADGRVSVMRNGEAWALFAGNTVHVGELILTGPDGVARLEISDGSSFEVYPNSRVIFRGNPGNLRELLEVYLGKIKVHIQSFGGRPNPYRVHSPTAVISVRGTVFEVAVEDDSVTLIAVEEGLVDVAHRLMPGKAVQLLPGQSLRIFPNASLAAAGLNKAGVAARVAEALRDALYVLRTVGVGGGGTTGGGVPGTGGATPAPPIPTDTPAPPPPPPPPPPGGNP